MYIQLNYQDILVLHVFKNFFKDFIFSAGRIDFFATICITLKQRTRFASTPDSACPRKDASIRKRLKSIECTVLSYIRSFSSMYSSLSSDKFIATLQEYSYYYFIFEIYGKYKSYSLQDNVSSCVEEDPSIMKSFCCYMKPTNFNFLVLKRKICSN